jgi:5-methyltetrahydrofolate--homocysteine methyltransferase
MQVLLERIRLGKTLVADGAMGTMLFERGVESGQCPEALNLTRPDLLEDIATAYLDAGADIIQTNTFGASPLKLAQYGLEKSAGDINRAAATVVRRVVGDRAYVSGSCGPSGRLLKPYGDAEPHDVYASFRTQVAALIDAGVDVICVETMTDLAEAKLAIQAAKDVSPDTPLMATMTFDRTPRGFFTVMGVTIEQAATGLREAGASIVGSNCGNGIENMIEVARGFRQCTDLPLLIQPNAGLPKLNDGEPAYPETPAFMAEKARELIDIGVSVIGGCCGTTPEHTRALRQMVDSVG